MTSRILFAVAFAVMKAIPVSTGALLLFGATAAALFAHLGMILLACVAIAEGALIAFLRLNGSARAAANQKEADLKQTSTPGAEFGSRLIDAQEQERTRIAGELHDDINQRMVLLANGLERLNHVPGSIQSPESKRELERLWKLVNEIATDIQHISYHLHPSKLYYLGLSAAVRDLCHEFARQSDIEAECNVRDVPVDLDENTTLSLFRTAQESLRNVLKHSQARHVKIDLSYESDLVRLRISDDGVGFNQHTVGGKSNVSSGLGLVSMQERLRSVGGQFVIWSRPGLGTQVEASAPVLLRRGIAS
jgi:signal transduction histidine kinase